MNGDSLAWVMQKSRVMRKETNRMKSIEAFLKGKRIALVGASRNPKDFSRAVLRELIAHGYDMVPVNPSDENIETEGRPVYRRLSDIPGALDGALLMTPASVTASIANELLACGVPRVWLHQGVGPGAVDPKAVELLLGRGVDVVAGECPMMFLDGGRGVHRLHAWIRRLLGTYPRAA
jgi:predicted CoA-binding protein